MLSLSKHLYLYIPLLLKEGLGVVDINPSQPPLEKELSFYFLRVLRALCVEPAHPSASSG